MKKKLTEEQENEVLALKKKGMTNTMIAKYMSEKYKIRITKKNIGDVLKRFKIYMTEKFYAPEIGKLDAQTLNKMLVDLLNIYKTVIEHLKVSLKEFGYQRKDIRTLNEVTDRIARLKQILSAEMSFTKELTFTKKASEQYDIE